MEKTKLALAIVFLALVVVAVAGQATAQDFSVQEDIKLENYGYGEAVVMSDFDQQAPEEGVSFN